MKKDEHNEQLEIHTIGFVLATVAHMRRFVEPEIKFRSCMTISFVAVPGWLLGACYRRKHFKTGGK